MTRSILAVPLRKADGEIFGVAELLNRRDGEPFDEGQHANGARDATT